MSRLLAFIVLALGFTFGALTGCATDSTQAVFGATRAAAHLTAVLVTQGDHIHCGGTIIGPHAVLSAEHCFPSYDNVAVDDIPVKITNVIKDGHDHVILMVDAKFAHFATLADTPQRYDLVYIFGNPDVFRDLYREGRVIGETTMRSGQKATLYDLNNYFGDSGSGIFNDRGQLVGVVSVMFCDFREDAGMKFAGSFPMTFTRADLQTAAVQ